MRVDLKFEGGRELERALADLPRSTSKGVARRALKQVLKPVAERADAYTDRFNVVVGTKLESRVKRRSRGDFAGHVVSMFVGPVNQDGSYAPEATLFEFGTGPRFWKSGKYTGYITPEPAMRPAWDAYSKTMLQDLGRLMWIEIEKTIARRAARAAKAG